MDDIFVPRRSGTDRSVPTFSEFHGTTLLEPTVLVIDDESINRMVLSGLLRSAGFTVHTASDGPTGRAMAQEHRPDLILLDVMMPGEDGFETCRLLKTDPELTDTPIIFISALTDVDSKVQGLEAGAVDYVTKPFEKAEVTARIRLHIKLQLAQRALIKEQAKMLKQVGDAQRSILVRPGDLPEALFAVDYEPVLEAGGDFYDVFASGGQSHCYFIADICGHDLGASFITSSLKALVRQNTGPLFTATETLKNMNAVLRSILKEGKFLTAQHLTVNRRQMHITLANAGHHPALILPRHGAPEQLDADGDILGAFEAVRAVPLERQVEKGDRIFLFTDGLVERFGPERRSMREGIEALIPYLESGRSAPLAQVVRGAVANMTDFGVRQADDVVLLGVEV